MACWTILKKKTCLGSWSACRGDPAVPLHLKNTAKYRLSIVGPHDTKLGHSRFQWKMKNEVVGCFDNLEKEDVSGHFEGCGVDPVVAPQECCRLPPTYFWVTWHQTRAFLIWVNNEKWFFWQVWQFWKRRRVWAVGALAGLIPWLYSTSGMLQPTANLLLGHMAPN